GLGQRLDVAPHGFQRYAKLAGQRRDGRGAFRLEYPQDVGVAFGQHCAPLFLPKLYALHVMRAIAGIKRAAKTQNATKAIDRNRLLAPYLTQGTGQGAVVFDPGTAVPETGLGSRPNREITMSARYMHDLVRGLAVSAFGLMA